MMRRSLFTALAAAAVATPALIAPGMVAPAAAQVDFNLVINQPPPPPRYEVVPAPRAGYVWAPGYWRWENRRHVWAPGHWVAERRGYHWVPDRWAQVDGGWRHQPGYWDRQQARAWGDRDHDGVPNAYDRAPNNPYRR
jgi:hypothetical protein